MLGLVQARASELRFDRVPDARRAARVKWSMESVLLMTVVALAAERKSFAQMEGLSEDLSTASRKRLRVARRLPDTTARDTMLGVEPETLRRPLYRLVRAAHRRKALRPVALPFGVVSLDGKYTRIKATEGDHVQRRSSDAGPYGLVGTISACLISSASKVCLDAEPIACGDGEETTYIKAVGRLLDEYGSLDLFRLVVYDAGGCSRVNARETRALGLHYMFRVKAGKQPKLHRASEQQLGSRTLEQADGVCQQAISGGVERRSVYLADMPVSWPRWTEQRAIVRVLVERLDAREQVVSHDDRYYVTSLAANALTPSQWIAVGRGHWAVENNCHHTWDAVLREDERPWITADGQGTLAVMMLRRIAYNILALFRSQCGAGGERSATPWRDLCRWLHNALIAASEQQLAGLRERTRLPEAA